MSDLFRSLWDATSTYFTTKYQVLQDAPYILQAIWDATSRHYFIETTHSFHKNISTKNRQYRHSLLPVTTPRLTLHKWNSLLIPLPLALTSMLFPDPRTEDASQPLLLASFLTKVPVRRPKNIMIYMAVFITPRPGSCLTLGRTNSNPNTIVLRHNSDMMPLPLSLPLHPIL